MSGGSTSTPSTSTPSTSYYSSFISEPRLFPKKISMRDQRSWYSTDDTKPILTYSLQDLMDRDIKIHEFVDEFDVCWSNSPPEWMEVKRIVWMIKIDNNRSL